MTDDLRKRAASAPADQVRPYGSNLVVDSRLRRRGVGKRLMAACEAEVAGWIDQRKACATNISLDVTTTNRVALDFYRAAGYVVVEGSLAPGTEMQREGDSFRMIDVQRCRMVKELVPPSP